MGEREAVDAIVAGAFGGGGERSRPERIILLLDPDDLVLAMHRDERGHAVGITSVRTQVPTNRSLSSQEVFVVVNCSAARLLVCSP
jgi:hypothetical protein